MAVFFLQSMTNGGIFTRIADLQLQIGLSKGDLGLALMGQPVAGLLTFFFASRIIETVGTRAVLGFGVCVLACSTMVLGIAPNTAGLFAGFFILGASFGITNVAMNVEADRIEASSGVRILNRCHGLWSLGFLSASLAGAAARGLGLSPIAHFMIITPIVVIGILIVVLPMRPAPPREHAGGQQKRIIAVPTLMTVVLVLYGLGGTLMEVSSRQWSVIYMNEAFSAPAFLETMVLPAFLLTQTVGRFLADGWTARHGPVRVATVLAVVTLAGLVTAVLAPNLIVAIIGFGLIGFGVCVSFPLMLSAAARLGDRPSSENVASVTMTTTFVMLGAPAAMGFVAETFGIRIAFAAMIPFVVLSLFLTRFLAPREPAGAGTSG